MSMELAIYVAPTELHVRELCRSRGSIVLSISSRWFPAAYTLLVTYCIFNHISPSSLPFTSDYFFFRANLSSIIATKPGK